MAQCLLTLLLAAGAAEEPAQEQWVLVNETRDGIVIHSRMMPGSRVREYRATIGIDTLPEHVWQAVMDRETYRHLSSYVVVNEIYKTGDDAVWYNYQVVAPPLISRRDYTLRYTSFEDPGKMLYRLVWTTAEDHGPPPSREMVRLTLCTGSLEIEPREGGRRAAINYRLCLDPGGSVPAWVVNFANRSSVPGFLRVIRDHSYEYRDRNKKK